jgi:hypothetical protein
MFLFILWPVIDKKPISESKLRFALVDYVLSFVVFTGILAYSTSENSHLGFKDVLSIFNLQWVFLSITFYGFMSAIVYTVVVQT